MEPDERSDADPHRRSLLALFGIGLLPGGLHAQTGAGVPACILTPQQTEGPYFIDRRLNRSDIRSGPAGGPPKAGVPLELTLHLSAVDGAGCKPLAGAIVDIWHCDAAGVYSDIADVAESKSASGTTGFLRGYQISDASGDVRFTTVYPGAYPGRAVHIHVKVRARSPSGRADEFTSQLYFDDALTDRVHAHKAYAVSDRTRRKNTQDGLYRNGGQRLMLSLQEHRDGYRGSFDFGIRV